MKNLNWLIAAVIAVLVATVSVFLSSVTYSDIPLGSIAAAVLIIAATRYIKVKHQSFWQSTLVIIFWGLITYRAATPTAMGDLVLMADEWTYWYLGITGVAALVSLILPTRSLVAKLPDEAPFQN